MPELEPAGYALRPYRDADFEACVELWRKCGITVSYNDPAEDVALWQRSTEAEILLAERGGAVVGTICVGHDGHRGWLYQVAVDPKLRHQGLGRKLVRAGEDWLIERGVPKVQLMIRPTNEGVRRFYESLGYELTPRLIMARWLKQLTGPQPVEPATLKVTVTYLEMTEPPRPEPAHPPSNRRIALLRAQKPTLKFYRFLYDAVGEDWTWWERRIIPDERLAAYLQDERVEVYVLYVEGQPAGFFELDGREAGRIDLGMFGLMPQFVGQGLGGWFLQAAVETAWERKPARVTVNTCTLDHPRALPLYQKAGFTPVRQEAKTIVDPRSIGILPPKQKAT
ncbi:Ribosomal protein S18 acetylase RimI [Tistlia consotensis]|uniref:Ribosomal protein S18 acetylase RimI n=1 Tax=Tistlia consotensis USBA 355 TaxID=560819 RepID=A0A1Y6BCZ3_9PROT|nr:GNAT family acetyltransferase [Tistlia consotensis]SMF04915.1 Ribosomal protein S18 acetylase RimI [Tistlia consotensis USBA 355]SNR54912.1 Ribosomal protein S18 acetylase RimI [Tistlia consotensis]